MTECISSCIPNVSTIANIIIAQSNQYSPLKKEKKKNNNHGKSLYTFTDSDLLPSNSYSKKKNIPNVLQIELREFLVWRGMNQVSNCGFNYSALQREGSHYYIM